MHEDLQDFISELNHFITKYQDNEQINVYLLDNFINSKISEYSPHQGDCC